MSGSLLEASPYGQGNTLASRAARAPLAPGLARVGMDWTPQVHQAQLLAVDRGILLSAGALGSGKSEPGALRLLKWALRYPRRPDGRPTKWYALGPDFSLLRQEQFGKILEHARRIKGAEVVKRVVGGQDPRIILCHDQVILGRSTTDADRLRGHEVDGFWLDEAQNVEEKAFRIAISRLRSTTAIRVVITGSPEDSPDWIWKLLSGEDEGYNRVRLRLIEEGSGLWPFRWSSIMNTANSTSVLGVVRAVLDASTHNASAQELEGRFPNTSEAPGQNALNFVRAFVGRVEIRGEEAIPQVLGVDIGETLDFSWLTVMSSRGVVLYQERFNAGSPGVPRATFYPFLQDRIEQLAGVWRVKKVAIDSAKSGKSLAQALAVKVGDRFKVEGVDTSIPGRKSEIVEALLLATAAGRVRVPTAWRLGGQPEQTVDHVPQLRKEFEEMTIYEVGKKRAFDHPSGGHDDGPVALAIAWKGLGGGGTPGAGLGAWKAPILGPTFFQ